MKENYDSILNTTTQDFNLTVYDFISLAEGGVYINRKLPLKKKLH